MKAIDPSNNYGGGKVKFFAGGSGGGGETIVLVPIMFGSNEVFTIGGGGFIPLNVSSYINQGSIRNSDYDSDSNASSYLPTIDVAKPYYYYASNGWIGTEGGLVTNVVVRLTLYIDDVEYQTIEVEMLGGSTATTFEFTKAEPLNAYPVSRYGILVTQQSGSETSFIVNVNNTFLSEYNSLEQKTEFFTSSNLNELEITSAPSGGSDQFFSFGGQTNAVNGFPSPTYKSIFGGLVTTEVRKIYIMFSESFDATGGGELAIAVIVDGIIYDAFSLTDLYDRYTPYEFELSTFAVATNGNVYLRISNSTAERCFIFEIGICGYELQND